MIDRAQLLSDLQRLLPALEQDVLAYNAGRADLASSCTTLQVLGLDQVGDGM